MSWAAYPILIGFFTFAYYVLRWIQRRSQYVDLPQLAEGQWHPLVANYNWSAENKFKAEYKNVKDSPNSNPTVLAQTLMRRAMHAIERISEMQEQKNTLNQLVKSGSIGEEVLHRFNNAESALNEECEEIAAEAQSLKPGWEMQIFQQAGQLLDVEFKRKLEQDRKREEEERKVQEQWDMERQKQESKIREDEARRLADELIQEEEQAKKKANSSNNNGNKKKKN